MAKYDIHIMESLAGVLETEEMVLFQGNREQRSHFEWNRLQGQYWGSWNIKKNNFRFLGNRETILLFQGNKGTVIPLRGSHKRSDFQTIQYFVCLFIRLSTRHIK